MKLCRGIRPFRVRRARPAGPLHRLVWLCAATLVCGGCGEAQGPVAPAALAAGDAAAEPTTSAAADAEGAAGADAAQDEVTSSPPGDSPATPGGSDHGAGEERAARGAPSDHSAEPQPAADASAAGRVAAGPPIAGDDDWPLFRGDPLGTGVARSPLPEQLELLWRVTFKNGAFEGAVAIVDDVIYAGCLDGNLYALNIVDGGTRWHFQTELGFVAAPSVRGEVLYIGDVDGRFYALDRRHGKPRWGRETASEIDAGANFYRDFVLVGSQDATLYCLTLDGQDAWKHTIEDQIRCMPTVVEGRCFLAGCDGKLHIIDLETGSSIAQVEIGSQTGCTPAVLGDYVYFGTEGETFYCVNWREAAIAWSYRNPQRSFPYRSSAAVTRDAVVVGSRDKLVHCFDPASGEEKWTFATKGRVDSSPVIVGQRVFVGSADGRIYGINLASGDEIWQYEAGGGFTASPAVARGRLVIGSDDGTLYCFGAK